MSIGFTDAIKMWTKIGLLSFGGPAAQIALMHQELVEKRRWISETRFLNALNFCMLLPGPEAQQLSIYLGWLLHRTRGGVVAGLLFILPGFFCMLLLSILYAKWGQTLEVTAIFFGLKAAILAIVAQAIFRIAKKTLTNKITITIAVSSFIALYFFNLAFPIVIFCAGMLGLISQKFLPSNAAVSAQHADKNTDSYPIDELMDTQHLQHVSPSLRHSLKTLLCWLLIWATPVVIVFSIFGADSVLARQASFFSQTAVFSFGGAYALLAYVAQRVVQDYQWLTPHEMVDGLALAETTPGPLIMVLQFVAFIAAYRHQDNLSPMTAGIIASCLTTWVSFAPCFLWIFLGAPYIEKLRHNLRLQSALKAITAAVVGVMTNLSLWFAVHALFTDSQRIEFNFIQFDMPVLHTLQWPILFITVVAIIASFKFKISSFKLMLLCTLLGLMMFYFVH